MGVQGTRDATSSFGLWLSQQRKERDLTQEDLAERIGCSVSLIQKIEVADRRPSKQVAELLADHFQIPAEQREAFLQFARGSADQGDITPPTVERPVQNPKPRTRNPNNLPVQLTSFVGRDIEVPRTRDMMLTTEVRLLTMTGPPGTGKTRLALQAATELLKEFEDGAFFVNLAPVSDPDLVVSEIAQTLGVRDSGTRSLLEMVEGYLKDRRVLLLLDNFEHVVEAAPQVAKLLMGAPNLKMIVTSRVPLHVRGEKEFLVPPLHLPDIQHLPPLERLRGYEAVQLFIKRGTDVSADFELTEDNASAVAHICARLDGLPLAIELAAARIKVLSPQVILARLESRLGLLTGGPRDLPSRQRTMRSAIEWSYDLLEEEERKLFGRLGVFVGGFSLEAAEVICAGRDADAQAKTRNEIAPVQLDVLEGIAGLVDKSLLRQQVQEVVGREPRLAMLETVREYALEQLDAGGEAEAMRRQHAYYFLALVENGIEGPELPLWLGRLDRDHDNLRAALGWLLERDEAAAAEDALRLLLTLRIFWNWRARPSEIEAWFESAFARLGSEVTPLRINALIRYSAIVRQRGNYPMARAWAERAIAMATELGHKSPIAAAFSNMGLIELFMGDYGAAQAILEESLALYRELGDNLSIGRILINLGEVARFQRDYTHAEVFYRESLDLHQTLGDKTGVLVSTTNLGRTLYQLGHFEEAKSAYLQALALAQELRSVVLAAEALIGLSSITMLNASQTTDKSDAANLRGLVQTACLCGFAVTLLETNERQLETLEQAEYDHNVVTTRERLGEEAFNTAWQEGRAMSMEQAVEYALNLDPSADH